MKAILLACALASFSAPAFAQDACAAAGESATEEFAFAINAANGALSAKDYGRALSIAAAARPEAMSQRQRVAVSQLEIAAVVGMNDRETATRLMKATLADRCLPDGVRTNYVAMLTKWGVLAN
jgi:hypothetical protein